MLGSSAIMAFLASTDLARAKKFYEGTLGLRVMSEEPSALVFDANGTPLRISLVEVLIPARYTALGWIVSDIESATRELAARGVVFERFPGFSQDREGIWTAPDSTKVAWFKDPEGNVLSLTQFP